MDETLFPLKLKGCASHEEQQDVVRMMLPISAATAGHRRVRQFFPLLFFFFFKKSMTLQRAKRPVYHLSTAQYLLWAIKRTLRGCCFNLRALLMALSRAEEMRA